jgi:YtxH-like protein
MFDSTSPPTPEPATTTNFSRVPRPGSIPQPSPQEAPVEMVPDWNAIGLFAAGIAVGAVLGATVALFLAPASGEETRQRVAGKVGQRDDDDIWSQLAEELDRAAADTEEEARETETALT